MKVMLLNPPNKYKVSKNSRWPEFTKSGTLYYPFWLAYATVVLREDGRHEPFLLDAIAKGLNFSETLGKMQAFNPELLVVDTSTPTIFRDLEFISEAKKNFPQMKVVLTGRHPTAMPDQTFATSDDVDFIARQEYEFTVLDLANNLSNGRELKIVSGLSWRDGQKIIHNEPRQLPTSEELDAMPFVSKAYKEFLNVWDYRYALARYPMIQIWTSRGCPARCVYCDYPQVFTMHGYRTRSPKNVVDEIEWIQKNLPDVKEVFFEDDTFTIDTERARAICKEIINRNLKVIWSCNVRANVDYETLRLMKESGCRILIVGYESGNQRVLNQMKKGIILKQAEEFTYNAKRCGLKIFGCFMIGLPGDNKESVHDTFNLAKRLMPDMVFFQPATPFPGTEFYNWAKQNGYLVTEDYGKWFDENGRLEVLINYPDLTKENISGLREKLMLNYYLNPKHILYTFMMNMHPHEMIRVVAYARDYILYLLNKFTAERKSISNLPEVRDDGNNAVPIGIPIEAKTD